jgi:hypothetical protein
MKESAREYAIRRANETRLTYLISAMGHVMVDAPGNRRVIDDCGGIAEIVRPRKGS